MKKILKILFYTANGVGLGHLRRTSLIAEAIKKEKPGTKIFFTTMCREAPFLDEAGISYVKLKYLVNKHFDKKYYSEHREAKEFNEARLKKTIHYFQPDLAVVDIYCFQNFSFPDSLFLPKYKKIKKILISRLGDKENFKATLKDKRLNLFSKILLPHSEEELKLKLSQKALASIKTDKRFIFTGPIIKKSDKSKVKQLRKKFNINKSDFLITLSLGGGGELTAAGCESPIEIIKSFLAGLEKLKNFIPNLKVVITIGPLNKFKKSILTYNKYFSEYLRIVNYEPNLMELISISKLAIGSAGYNFCNEITAVKTPTILIPLLRGNKEQHERAKILEKKEACVLVNTNNPQVLLNKIKYCVSNLDRMSKQLKKINIRRGNKTAAKIILDLING